MLAGIKCVVTAGDVVARAREKVAELIQLLDSARAR